MDCRYNDVSSINLLEASLHYTTYVNENSWKNSNYPKIDCVGETYKWSALKLNYTYSTQKECDKFLTKEPGFRKGATCLLTKNYLITNLFKLNRYVLEVLSDVYPIPFSFQIKYVCS